MWKLKNPNKGTWFELLPVGLISVVLLFGFVFVMADYAMHGLEVQTYTKVYSGAYSNMKYSSAIYTFLMMEKNISIGEEIEKINTSTCLKFLDCENELGTTCKKYYGEQYSKDSCEKMISKAIEELFKENYVNIKFGDYKKTFGEEKKTENKYAFVYELFVPFKKKTEKLIIEVK